MRIYITRAPCYFVCMHSRLGGSHFLSPLSKERSLSESESTLLLYSPLQVFTVRYTFSYYLTIFKPLSFFVSVSEMIF